MSDDLTPATPPVDPTPAPANPARGETSVTIGDLTLTLRPSYGALTSAEGELGSLFKLVERAADGGIALAELVALFWHCLHDAPATLTRAAFAEGIVAAGLAKATPVLGHLIRQILGGR